MTSLPFAKDRTSMSNSPAVQVVKVLLMDLSQARVYGLALVDNALQDAIGGYLQIADIGDGWHAYMDEEGWYKTLPVNAAATAMLHALGWRGGFVCGPVIFLGSDYMDGEESDVPDDVLAMGRTLHLLPPVTSAPEQG
jgi:hypothetical protein